MAAMTPTPLPPEIQIIVHAPALFMYFNVHSNGLNTAAATALTIKHTCARANKGQQTPHLQQFEILLWDNEMPVLFLRTNTTTG